MQEINEVNEPNRKNNTQQKYHPTKPTSILPYRRRCQPPRVAKNCTVEGQLIGSKHSNVKNTSRQSLINQQRERDRNIEQYTNVDSQIEDVTNEDCNIPVRQTDSYNLPAPEHSDQIPITITQDESCDGNIDNGIQKQNLKFHTNIIQVQNSNGPACISQTALY